MSLTKIKERPILFSGPMVKAILDGSKTMTRRAVNPQPVNLQYGPGGEPWDGSTGNTIMPCPYGSPGDQLWVREGFSRCRCQRCEAAWPGKPAPDQIGCVHYPSYRATHTGPSGLVWKSPIHMPRWASRITLEITDVRVERLQDITQYDAELEGIETVDYHRYDGEVRQHYAVGDICESCPREAFRLLWSSINAKTHPWESNPWVWVVEFQRLEQD